MVKTIGIDIGTSSIKVVEVQMTKKGLLVTQAFERTLGVNPAYDKDLETIEFFREFANLWSASQARVVTGLNQNQVSLRRKFFPFQDRIKILKSLSFELEDEIPLENENALFDAKIIQFKGTGTDVLAQAVPKASLRELMQIAADSGLDISVVSSEAFAYANLVENPLAPPPQVATSMIEEEGLRIQAQLEVHLQIGQSHTILSAFENNRLVAVRSIPWGVRFVAENISKRYEIPFIEALNEMNQKAFILLNKETASYDQIAFSETIASAFKDLVRELKLTLIDLNSDLNGQIQQIYLSGGGSRIINLAAHLTQNLEIACNVFKAQQSIATSEKVGVLDSRYSLALGYALEGHKKPKNPPVNFLKNEFAKKNKRLQTFVETWGSLIQAGVLVFVFFIVDSQLRTSLTTDLSSKTDDVLKAQARNIAKLSGKQANVVGVKKYLKEQKKKMDDYQLIQQALQMNSSLDVLKKISDSIPQKNQIRIQISRLAIEGKEVQLEGRVGSLQEMTSLQKSLSTLALGPVQQMLGSGAPPNGTSVKGVAFHYQFSVDRGFNNTTTKK